ncbi:hypothetical protein [Flavobacterium sp.]|uniref:hypothetical protein n=1 Tax=Flavobacterium sp. TaxID=239 RepID=UPI0008C3EBD1|nr:hypothetical protein [Flavobacterium sp.]OGS60391.1 MAG: hypothetical protein A2X07_05585 [Flavobacteria bacterium GWF1_32_7]HBD25443.1 hypothetical protein [Flavobacterium sp.]
MSNVEIWKGSAGIELPNEISNVDEIVPYANSLTIRQQQQIISAYQIKAFDMAAEYAWKKAMTKLKETISTLGMKFIGEMIGRTDLDEYSTVETELTDYNTINLAEQLGVINSTAALKLKQANDLISHYFSKNANEELDNITALQIIKSSVQYILGESDISIALEFSNFRDRLIGETLNLRDTQVEQIINSPLFYIRTVLSILLASIRTDNGAKLENSISNLNLLINPFWPKLAESDKWNIGTLYRDVTASGNSIASSGVKNALLKVSGFDYVPENLRSVTYIKAAKHLLDIHFEFNNFYNEPSAIRKLANLGNTIPLPAFIDCIDAYLVVYLGNSYGNSDIATPIAEEKLSEISIDRWEYYFSKVIQNDEIILTKLQTKRCAMRFKNLLIKYELNKFIDLPRDNQQLYDALLKEDYNRVNSIGLTLYNRFKKNNK